MLFKDKYFFLSNFYICDIQLELGGKICKFCNSEAAFQAQKNISVADRFSQVKGLEAKRLGQDLKITTPDWDNYRLYAMAYALHAKFKHIDLLVKLKEIKEDIEETNYWYDTYWGVCKGEGKNMLGKMLMNIRDNNNDLTSLLNYIKTDLINDN